MAAHRQRELLEKQQVLQFEHQTEMQVTQLEQMNRQNHLLNVQIRCAVLDEHILKERLGEAVARRQRAEALVNVDAPTGNVG